MRLYIPVVMLFAVVLMSSRDATADLTYNIYTDKASFNTAVTGPWTAYDFEPVAVSTDCRVYDFGDFSTNGSLLYRVDIEDENTHELHFNTSSYTQNLTVSFVSPIVAFGFDWRNTDNNDDEIRVDFDGTRYVLGSKDETGFWGVAVTSGQITTDMSFLFGDTSGGSGWTEGNLDNFTYVIPEPASLLLMGAGVLMLMKRW